MCKNVRNCDRTSHIWKTAARTHIARKFQKPFRTHIAHVRTCAHMCVCEFNFATHSLAEIFRLVFGSNEYRTICFWKLLTFRRLCVQLIFAWFLFKKSILTCNFFFQLLKKGILHWSDLMVWSRQFSIILILLSCLYVYQNHTMVLRSQKLKNLLLPDGVNLMIIRVKLKSLEKVWQMRCCINFQYQFMKNQDAIMFLKEWMKHIFVQGMFLKGNLFWYIIFYL